MVDRFARDHMANVCMWFSIRGRVACNKGVGVGEQGSPAPITPLLLSKDRQVDGAPRSKHAAWLRSPGEEEASRQRNFPYSFHRDKQTFNQETDNTPEEGRQSACLVAVRVCV